MLTNLIELKNSTEPRVEPQGVARSHLDNVIQTRDIPIIDNTLFLRKAKIIDTLSKLNISYKGSNSKDPERFIKKLQQCQRATGITNDEILRILPTIFKGEALKSCMKLKAQTG